MTVKDPQVVKYKAHMEGGHPALQPFEQVLVAWLLELDYESAAAKIRRHLPEQGIAITEAQQTGATVFTVRDRNGDPEGFVRVSKEGPERSLIEVVACQQWRQMDPKRDEINHARQQHMAQLFDRLRRRLPPEIQEHIKAPIPNAGGDRPTPQAEGVPRVGPPSPREEQARQDERIKVLFGELYSDEEIGRRIGQSDRNVRRHLARLGLRRRPRKRRPGPKPA